MTSLIKRIKDLEKESQKIPHEPLDLDTESKNSLVLRIRKHAEKLKEGGEESNKPSKTDRIKDIAAKIPKSKVPKIKRKAGFEAEEEPETLTGYNLFQFVIAKNPRTEQRIKALNITMALLRDHRHKKTDESLLETVNYNAENLYEILRSVFGFFSAEIDEKHEIDALLDTNKKIGQILCEDILRFNEETTEEEMEIAINQLLKRTKPLQEFLDNPDWNVILKLIQKTREGAELSLADIRMLENDVANQTSFDTEAVRKMLEEVIQQNNS